MAVHSLVLDGVRHVDNNAFTRCGKLIPYGTPWQEDPREGDPGGKLCKVCYASVDAEEQAQVEHAAALDADSAPAKAEKPSGKK